jgi:hypothetical protein
MSIFTRASDRRQSQAPTVAAEAVAQPAPVALPEGYDQPGSASFVPVHLREHYRVDPARDSVRLNEPGARYSAALWALRQRLSSDPALWQQQLETDWERLRGSGLDRHQIHRIAAEAGPERYVPPAREFEPELEDALAPEDAEHWLHTIRLADARVAYDAATTAAKRDEEVRRSRTCAVCGVQHRERLRTYTIDYAAGTVTPQHGGSVRMCGGARAALTARLGARALAREVNGKCLAELVDEFIDAAGK